MLRPKFRKLIKRTFARNGLAHSLAKLAIRRMGRGLGLWNARIAEDLVVSLTSFPPRIGKVHLVVQSLLNQSLQPRRIVLYLSRDEFPGNKVPRRLARLEDGRFEIRFVEEENLRSYKKLLFALVDFPDDWIATFDDDRLYPAHTLARLWQAAAVNPRTIICAGGRQMVFRMGSSRTTANGHSLCPLSPASMCFQLAGMGSSTHQGRSTLWSVTGFWSETWLL